VRTHKAFWTSRPSPVLGLLTLGVAVLAIAIPYLPHASLFGFIPLPAPLMAGLTGITLLYIAVSEASKHLFFIHEARRQSRARRHPRKAVPAA